MAKGVRPRRLIATSLGPVSRWMHQVLCLWKSLGTAVHLRHAATFDAHERNVNQVTLSQIPKTDGAGET